MKYFIVTIQKNATTHSGLDIKKIKTAAPKSDTIQPELEKLTVQILKSKIKTKKKVKTSGLAKYCLKSENQTFWTWHGI